MMMQHSDAGQMAAMGAVTGILAPALILATRDRIAWRPLAWPALVAAIFFVMWHAVLTVVVPMPMHWPALLAHGFALLVGAMIFWLPVLGRARPLPLDLSCVYLFLAAPALDLSGVVLVARGDAAGGLAMIVAMLPIGVVAVARSWRWLEADERAVHERVGT